MGLYPAPAGHVEPYFYYDEWVQAQRTAAGGRSCAAKGRRHQEMGPVEGRPEQLERPGGRPDRPDAFRRPCRPGYRRGGGAGHRQRRGVPRERPARRRGAGLQPGHGPGGLLQGHQATASSRSPSRHFTPPVFVQQSHLAAVQKMVVTGVLQKNRQMLLEALCVHPFTRSLATARRALRRDVEGRREAGSSGAVLGKLTESGITSIYRKGE